MEEENIDGEAIVKGKNHVIREICKLDNSKTPDELKKFVFSELVKMKKDLKTVTPVVEEEFVKTGAYRFSSYNE
tara:strand:+ start:294 stop:515 length:222 start_codon:yes stop_codon:yes gene_type:complete